MMKTRHGVLAVFLFLCAGSAAAGALESLRQFVASAQGAEGEFRQTVIGTPEQPPQQASGKFAFSRPGKFRWEYDQPYPQLLVADGKQLWSWDQDLRQVTVRPLGGALGATPAGILFGQSDLEGNFILSEIAKNDERIPPACEKLVWVEAQPRPAADGSAGSSGFQSFRFGFDGKRLQCLSMRDNFGQSTVIEFIGLKLNPSFAAHYFHFEPPAGVDILGDPALPR